MKQMLVLAPVKQPLDMENYSEYDAEVSRMSKAAVEQLGEYAQAMDADTGPLTRRHEDMVQTGDYLEYLYNTLRAMKYRDYVVFGKDWSENREHRILHYIAMEYGKKVLEV